MITKSDAWVKVTIAVSALLVGIAFGHWGAAPARPTVLATAPMQVNSPNDKNLTSNSADFATNAKKAMLTPDKAKAEPGDLAGILQERAGTDRLHDLTSYVDRLAAGDIGAALEAAQKLPHGADRDLAQRLLIAHWAELDPDSALAFAAKHKEFGDMTGDVFQQLASSDLTGALSKAQAITDPSLHYQAMRGALGVMAATDPAGALRLAADSASVPHTEPLSSMIYRQWAETDPAAAATAAAQEPSTDQWRSPLGQVIRTWASTDPQAALNYTMTMNDADAQSRSVSDIVRRWSDQDPTAVAGWINTVPAGPVRDAAAASFASSVASTDVSSAVGWAQSISDDSARTSALQRVSRRVMWDDPTNGATTLQTAGVPAEILQNLPSRRGR